MEKCILLELLVFSKYTSAQNTVPQSGLKSGKAWVWHLNNPNLVFDTDKVRIV